MNKIFQIIPAAALALAFGGCSDYLTTESSTKIDGNVLLQNTEGLTSVLRSTYKYFLLGNDKESSDSGTGTLDQSGCTYTGIPGYCMYYDLAGADIISTINYGGGVEDAYKFQNTRTQASGNASRIWTTMYKTINEANIILDALPAATGEAVDKQAIQGQCLAMRGICYFNLIMNYQQTYAIAKDKRGVILRTSSSDPNSKGFSTVQQCYDQILSDLKAAKTDLANFKRDDEYEVNADVVSGYLARVYQVMGDWKNAYAEASALYQKYPTLMSKEEWYSGFDNLISDGCPELIWGIKYTSDTNISSGTEFNYWYNQDPSYGEGMSDGPIYSFLNMLVDSKYVALFDKTDYRGFRCDKTSGVTDADEKGVVMFWHRTANGDNEIAKRWAYNKFKYYGDANGAKQGHSYPEFPLMRSSEMLLIAAEAAAHLGNNGQALELLNTLQKARDVSKPTTSADDLLESIYVERRKELLGEGVTGMYDLLRLQKGLTRYGASDTNPAGHYPWGLMNLDGYNASEAQPEGTLASNDYRFICQIPQGEFTSNTAISTSDQNPFSGQ
ncbi:MAG: RagB/SusD family nutrient uptake outer membrane protein [Tannerella sp.]|jgi:hypothetical protein|nr:RagB/SusD family nutrient uptake outer membrane protein [Tannerella sp.]